MLQDNDQSFPVMQADSAKRLPCTARRRRIVCENNSISLPWEKKANGCFVDRAESDETCNAWLLHFSFIAPFCMCEMRRSRKEPGKLDSSVVTLQLHFCYICIQIDLEIHQLTLLMRSGGKKTCRLNQDSDCFCWLPSPGKKTWEHRSFLPSHSLWKLLPTPTDIEGFYFIEKPVLISLWPKSYPCMPLLSFLIERTVLSGTSGNCLWQYNNNNLLLKFQERSWDFATKEEESNEGIEGGGSGEM